MSSVWASAGALTVCGMVNRGSPHRHEWAQNHKTNPVSSQGDKDRNVKHKLSADCEIVTFYIQHSLYKITFYRTEALC